MARTATWTQSVRSLRHKSAGSSFLTPVTSLFIPPSTFAVQFRPSRRRVLLNIDVYHHVLHYLDAVADIARCRLVCRAFERIAARRLLERCSVVLRNGDDAVAFYRFMFDYELADPPFDGIGAEEQREKIYLTTEREAGEEGEEKSTAIEKGSPRRFRYFDGHMTLAVGREVSTPVYLKALQAIFTHATHLASLTVEDFDETVCAEPSLLQMWTGLPGLKKLAADYRPNVRSNEDVEVFMPEEQETQHETDAAEHGVDAEHLEEVVQDTGLKEWKSDALLRAARLDGVQELVLHFGKRMSMPLGDWVAACPKVVRIHLCTGMDDARIAVLHQDAATQPTITIRFKILSPEELNKSRNSDTENQNDEVNDLEQPNKIKAHKLAC